MASGKPGTGRNGRSDDRRGGLHAAWAIIITDDRTEIPCWVIDESKTGCGFETRKQFFPLPLEAGATYWMTLKPSHARTASWVAGTIKHFREKGNGSGIYRIGVKITSVPPAALGEAPEI